MPSTNDPLLALKKIEGNDASDIFDDFDRFLKMPDCADRSLVCLKTFFECIKCDIISQATTVLGQSEVKKKQQETFFSFDTFLKEHGTSNELKGQFLKKLVLHQEDFSAIFFACDVDVNSWREILMNLFDKFSEDFTEENVDCVMHQVAVDKIKNSITSGDLTFAKTLIDQLFYAIHQVNLPLLVELINKATEASQLILDKDIILFLGCTGSGKSTTIHFLAGSRLEQKKVLTGQHEGVETFDVHIGPVEINAACPSMANFHTGSLNDSVTRFIQAIDIPYKSIDCNLPGSFILCDSPGFNDTAGPAVDIANGYGIVRAVKKCKSVKIVALFSAIDFGSRLKSLVDSAKTIASLVDKLDENLKSVEYIYTKVPHDNPVMSSLMKMKNNPGKEYADNIAFKSLINDMWEKASSEKSSIMLDPLRSEGGPAALALRLNDIPAIMVCKLHLVNIYLLCRSTVL